MKRPGRPKKAVPKTAAKKKPIKQYSEREKELAQIIHDLQVQNHTLKAFIYDITFGSEGVYV